MYDNRSMMMMNQQQPRWMPQPRQYHLQPLSAQPQPYPPPQQQPQPAPLMQGMRAMGSMYNMGMRRNPSMYQQQQQQQQQPHMRQQSFYGNRLQYAQMYQQQFQHMQVQRQQSFCQMRQQQQYEDGSPTDWAIDGAGEGIRQNSAAMSCNDPSFPSSHLISQYPPEYQEQIVNYYQELREQQPQIYQQYAQYGNKYYGSPQSQLHQQVPQQQQQQQQQPYPTQQQQQPYPPQQQQQQQSPLQMPHHNSALPPPPAEQTMQRKSSSGSVGTLERGSSTLSRQSSIRRQNSIRRSERRNDTGLPRLPSMRNSIA